MNTITIAVTEVNGFKIEVLRTDDIFTVKEFEITNPSEYVSCNFKDLTNAMLHVSERSMYHLNLIGGTDKIQLMEV